MSRLEIVAVLLLFTLSLGLRVTGLDSFITADEIRWTCRSIQFREALRKGDWAGTFRVGHPGVVTTWVGAASIPWGQAQAEDSCKASRGGMELDRIATTPKELTQRIADLGPLLFSGRMGVALFTSLCIVVTYLLVRLNFGPRVAVLGLSLVALDPFYLALSRVLHVDAVLAGLMSVSVLAILAALHHSRSRPWQLGLLALSGVAGGLAMVQKSPALFLVPGTALLLAAYAWQEGASRRILVRAGRDLMYWSLIVVVVYVAVWPAMWADPLGTIERVADKAIGYAEEGHEPGNYFLGTPVQDPGWGYYPVALLFRIGPLVLAGLIASLFWLARGGELGQLRFDVFALLLYSVLFGAFMSFGSKKFDRYLLPAFPALGIVAAVGLVELVETLHNRLTMTVPGPGLLYASLFSAVVLVQGVLVLPHYPHYLTYYNPLLGGLGQARSTLVVGWGEGYEEAAAYLNSRPDARELQVAVPTYAAFAPLFSGETRPISDYSVAQTDYVIFYLAQVQRQHDKALMEEYFSNPQVEPEHTVALHGVEYAWIYRNRHYVEPMSALEAHSQPGRDILLVNGDSVFGKHYRGALEVREFHRRSSPQEVARLLDDLPFDSQRVWYPRYSDIDPEAVIRLLRNRGLLVEQRGFADLTLVLFRLLGEQRPLESVDLRFDGLRLSGHATTCPLPAWGRDGGVLLQWESERPLEQDYTAFVHLYDSRGHRIAQGDSLIVRQDLLPTSQWEPGSSATTLHHLSIPAGTPPGLHELQIGVYIPETGERLPLSDAEGEDGQTFTTVPVEVGLPDRPPDVADLEIAHPLEIDIGSHLRLLGYDLEHRGVLAGEHISIRLAWKVLGKPDQTYQVRLRTRGADGTVYAGQDFGFVATGYAATEWSPGAVFQEWYDIPLGEHLTTGEMTLLVNLVGADGRSVLAHPVQLTDVWVQSKERSFHTPSSMNNQSEVDLGESISLLGYNMELEEGRPEDVLKVTLYWQANAEVTRNYKVFVHLYDREGSIIEQKDRAPGLGIRPTTSWKPGEVIADRYHVEIGTELAPGTYSVTVGLYDMATGERLPAFRAQGEHLRQNSILLGEIRIKR